MNYEQALVQLGFLLENIKEYLPKSEDQKILYENFNTLSRMGFVREHYFHLFNKKKSPSAVHFVHAIPVFILHYNTIKQILKINEVSAFVELMKCDSFVTAMPVLIDNHKALASLGINSAEHYIALFRPRDAQFTIKQLVDSAAALATIKIVSPQHLVSIASHDAGRKTILFLVDHGADLIRKLKIEQNIQILITITNHNNASAVLEALNQSFEVLHDELQISELSDFVAICVSIGASEIIKSLATWGPQLKEELQFTTQQLIDIASKPRSGASLTIQFIAENILRLKEAGVSSQQILNLPHFFTHKSSHKTRVKELLGLLNPNGLSSTSLLSKRKLTAEGNETEAQVSSSQSIVHIKQEPTDSSDNLSMPIDPLSDDSSLPLMNLKQTDYREASTSIKESTTTVASDTSGPKSKRRYISSVSQVAAFKAFQQTTLGAASALSILSGDDDNDDRNSSIDLIEDVNLEKALQDREFGLGYIRSHLNTISLQRSMLLYYDTLKQIGFRSEHYQTLFSNFSPTSTSSFVNAIPTFLKHYRSLTALKIIKIMDYIHIMKQQGSYNAIEALIAHKDGLTNIGITDPDDLVAITKAGGASLAIPALVDKENIKKLRKIGISTPKQLVKIARYNGANNAILALVQKGEELVELMDITNIEELINSANHNGGGPAIVALAENLHTLQNTLKITESKDIFSFMRCTGASKTILALALHGETLMQQLGFTSKDLVWMASAPNGAGSTLEWIASNIQQLKLRSISVKQILKIYLAKPGSFNRNPNNRNTTHPVREQKLNQLLFGSQPIQNHSEASTTSHPVKIEQGQEASTSSTMSRLQTESSALINNPATLFGNAPDNHLATRRNPGRARKITSHTAADTTQSLIPIINIKQEFLDEEFNPIVNTRIAREHVVPTSTTTSEERELPASAPMSNDDAPQFEIKLMSSNSFFKKSHPSREEDDDESISYSMDEISQ